MHNYKELEIWKASLKICTPIYKLTKTFPDDEKFGLISQIRRAAVSVPSNIAEGSSRSSNKEFSHFLSIALGSLFELETQLQLSIDLNFLKQISVEKLMLDIIQLQKKISTFKKTLI